MGTSVYFQYLLHAEIQAMRFSGGLNSTWRQVERFNDLEYYQAISVE